MPLQAPINYLVPVPDPAAEARKNLEFGLGLMGAQQAIQTNQQRALLFEQQLTETQRKEQERLKMEADLDAFHANQTLDGAHNLVSRYPTLSERYKPILDRLETKEKDAFVAQNLPIYSALYNNSPDIELKKAEELATAYENSGKAADAKVLREKAALITKNPAVALAEFGSPLFAAMGKERFDTVLAPVIEKRRQAIAEAQNAENLAAKSGVEAAAAKKYGMSAGAADLLKKQSDASLAQTNATVADKTALQAAQAGIAQSQAAADSSKATTEKTKLEIGDIKAGVLTGDVLKQANKEISEAGTADQVADNSARLSTLAKQTLKKGGVFASLDEAVKQKLGKEDAVTALRKQITALLNAEVLKGLPPGAASEKELEFAQSAILSPNSNPEVLVDALDRMTAVSRTAANLGRARGAWMSSNRGNLAAPAAKDFTIQGLTGLGSIPVKAGSTFKDVQDAIAAPSRPPGSAGPSAGQIQSARDYVSHPQADPAKVAALKAKFAAAGVTL